MLRQPVDPTEESSVTRKKYFRRSKADKDKPESDIQELLPQSTQTVNLQNYSQRPTLNIHGLALIEELMRTEKLWENPKSVLEGEESDLKIEKITQESLMMIPSVEDKEIARQRLANETERSPTSCSESSEATTCRSPRYPNISVFTGFRELKCQDIGVPNSDDSTPHLYIDYKDRLQNILLEYFEE